MLIHFWRETNHLKGEETDYTPWLGISSVKHLLFTAVVSEDV